MATRQELELQINTSVEAGQAASDLRSLSREIRELNGLALKFGDDFPEAASKARQEAARLADRLDDARENLADMKGEPLERIRASVGRLQEGFMNLDLGKITQSFKNLGTAVSSAGGIFALLVGAIMLIIENFDTLKNSGGMVGDIFTAIGSVVETLKDVFLDLADSIGLIDKEQVKLLGNEKNAKDSKDGLAGSTKLYNQTQERELELMRARGEEQDKILRKEKEFINQKIRETERAIKDEEKRQRAAQKESKPSALGGVLSGIAPGLAVALTARQAAQAAMESQTLRNLKEQLDVLKHQLSVKEAQLDTTIREQKAKKTETKEEKKEIKGIDIPLVKQALPIRGTTALPSLPKQPNLIGQSEEVMKINEAEFERLTLIKQQEEAYFKLGDTFSKLALNFMNTGNILAGAIGQAFSGLSTNIMDGLKKVNEGKSTLTEAALSAASNLTSGISSILQAGIQQDLTASKRQTDERLRDLNKQLDNGIITQEEFNKRKYDLELAQFNKESELKRQAFEQNKAIQIVQAIILSTQAALAAFTQGNIAGGPVVGGIFAGIAAAFGAAQVALIASQQYPGDGAGPTRMTNQVSTPGGGLGGGQPNALALADIGGRLTTQNRQEEMRVYVLEKDITSAQGRTAQIKNRSRR